jgi:sulfur-oxidizing protein SoxY
MFAVARRRLLALLAASLAGAGLPRRASAQEDPFAALLRDMTGGVRVTPGRVVIETPILADNGHSVPMRLRVDSPMSLTDRVRSIVLLSEKNPRPVIARFHFGAAAGRAEVTTRVRLNGTQRLLAVAALADGTYWSGEASVIVTESACLDES